MQLSIGKMWHDILQGDGEGGVGPGGGGGLLIVVVACLESTVAWPPPFFLRSHDFTENPFHDVSATLIG